MSQTGDVRALRKPFVNGLRKGTLVTIDGYGRDVDGQLGVLDSFSEADGCSIKLVGGDLVEIPEGCVFLPEDLQRPGLGGGPESFDLVLGSSSTLSPEELGEEIAHCLFEKGFCVLKANHDEDALSEALDFMHLLTDCGKLQRLPEEVEKYYLGAANKGKVTWLDHASMGFREVSKCLKKSDEELTRIAGLLQPHALDIFRHNMQERTPALVSLTLNDDEEPAYPPSDCDDGMLGNFLRVFKSRLVQAVQFFGPGSAEIALESVGSEEVRKLPHPQEVVEITAGPNTLLLFDPRVFDYKCESLDEVLSMSTTFVTSGGEWLLDTFEGDSGFLFHGAGAYGMDADKDKVNIVNMACRMMSSYDEPEMYRAGLWGGCDSGVSIPNLRWDIQTYYTADWDSLEPWQSPTRHQSLSEGVELFDNKYFEIPTAEARTMDPMHRYILEVGAKNLFKMGITKKMASRESHHAGFVVGQDKSDWDTGFIGKDIEAQGGNNAMALMGNRFSFVFNMKGPCFVTDTACSSALTATHMAKLGMMDRIADKLEFYICVGCHLSLIAKWWQGGKQQTSISAIGRCFTFNESAGGYMRGDGTSGITLKYGNLPEARDGILRSSQVGQNGKSATISAPNGLSQTMIIENTLKEAKMTPSESLAWCCHGTGTALGDPIEIGAIRRCQMKAEREQPLIVLTNKTHTGHLEGGAAMTQVLAVCWMSKFQHGVGCQHLRCVNPNMDATMFSAIIMSESMSFGHTQGNTHINSWGFGGTIAHAIVWAQSLFQVPDVPTAFEKKLKAMRPPEVRVNGRDPSDWEWDGPDPLVSKDTKYRIELSSEDTEDAQIRWIKVENAEILEEDDDGEADFYCVTGDFSDWEPERMEESPTKGLHSLSVEIPDTGVIEFRVIKNGEDDQVLHPPEDKCTSRLAPILGPHNIEEEQSAANVWQVSGEPGDACEIKLFMSRGRRSVTWTVNAGGGAVASRREE